MWLSGRVLQAAGHVQRSEAGLDCLLTSLGMSSSDWQHPEPSPCLTFTGVPASYMDDCLHHAGQGPPGPSLQFHYQVGVWGGTTMGGPCSPGGVT